MTIDSTALEDDLVVAFNELADTLPQRSLPLAALHPRPRRASRRRARVLVAAAVGITAVAVAAFGVTRLLDVDDAGRTHRPSVAAQQPTEPSPSTRSAPSGASGAEVPLQPASTTDSDNLTRAILRRDPNANPIVVQIPDRAPVTVYSDGSQRCMTIAAAPIPAAGDQGSCVSVDQASQRIIGAIDTGPVETPTSVTYGVWTNVPEGTDYVTFTYGDQTAWQRPVAGISYFTVPGSRPSLGSEPVVLRAFDATGRQLGQATATPYLDGAGSWRWQ
jgi:hypothetical protein